MAHLAGRPHRQGLATPSLLVPCLEPASLKIQNGRPHHTLVMMGLPSTLKKLQN